VDLHQEALSIYQANDNLPGQASAYTNLGTAQERLGRHEEALSSHQRALTVYTDLDEPEHRPETEAAVVVALQRLGRTDEASDLLVQFLKPYDPATSSLTPTALNRFAEALRTANRWPEAARWYRSALRSAQAGSDLYEQARALDGIAHTRQHFGDRSAARQQWQMALDLYTGLGVPDVEQVKAAMPYTD
jgi:tetratricopeptide (TPR) repeat protein